MINRSIKKLQALAGRTGPPVATLRTFRRAACRGGTRTRRRRRLAAGARLSERTQRLGVSARPGAPGPPSQQGAGAQAATGSHSACRRRHAADTGPGPSESESVQSRRQRGRSLSHRMPPHLSLRAHARATECPRWPERHFAQASWRRGGRGRAGGHRDSDFARAHWEAVTQ